MNCNYTIIIPHHNIPNLLQRCLKSIPIRDDVQVIVVDDCSDECYDDELNKVKGSYPQVTFIMNDKCGGGGVARNKGLENAKGKYVIFADADDFFNDCFEEVLNDYCNTDYDLIFFKGNSVDTDTFEPDRRADHLNSFVDQYLSGKDQQGLLLRYKFGEPWARFVKASIIKDNAIRFDETLIHNDTTYSYLVGYYGKSMHVDSRELYCVTVRKGSVSRVISEDRILTRINVFGRAFLFFEKNNIKIKQIRHFEELLVLLLHVRFLLFKKGIEVLREQGYSYTKIMKGMGMSFKDILENYLIK